jgi:Lrp/AsnC family leucine-responsive transcriptional regulator
VPPISKAKPAKHVRSETSGIDAIDRRIRIALDEDGRLSMPELGRIVGLSPPSVTERVRRLKRTGVIRGFTIDVDLGALGYGIQAMVRIRPLPGKLHIVQRLIEERPDIIACDKVTGDDPFIARLVVRTIEDMDGVLEALSEHATTSTMVVKAAAVRPRLPPL